MHERDAVGALIERIVAGAHIPGASAREDLRRELWSHFDEAGASPEAIHEALGRFGTESLVTESLYRVYRFEYAAAYLAKIAASIVASVAAALLIQVLANFRVEAQAEMWRLAPGFSRAAGVSIAVVLGLVTAWEGVKPPFNRSRVAVALGAYAVIWLLAQAWFGTDITAFLTPTILVVLAHVCSTLKPMLVRLLLIFGAFAAVLYVRHLELNVAFGPSRALLAGAVLVGVWSSTVLILARVDHAFLRVFGPAHREAV